MQTSLEKADVVRFRESGSIKNILDTDAHVILTGDLTDRGERNQHVFDRVEELRRKMALTVLLGNHDTMVGEICETNGLRTAATWFKYGGAEFLQEIAQREKLFISRKLKRRNEPVNGVGALVEEDTDDTWENFLRENDWEKINLRKACAALRKRYRSQYQDILHGADILANPLPGVLAVHAGVTQRLLETYENIEGVQDAFSKLTKKKKFATLNNRTEPLSDIPWIRASKHWDRKLITPEAATLLRQNGLSLLIRGHEVQHEQQTLVDSHGMWVLNTDIGMSDGYSQYPNTWGYVKIHTNGKVTASCSKRPHQDIGVIEKDGQFRPSQA